MVQSTLVLVGNQWIKKSSCQPADYVYANGVQEIIMKLSMRGTVLNLPVGHKKCGNPVRISCWFNTASDIVVVKVQV
jgi:hypothetical protein